MVIRVIKRRDKRGRGKENQSQRCQSAWPVLLPNKSTMDLRAWGRGRWGKDERAVKIQDGNLEKLAAGTVAAVQSGAARHPCTSSIVGVHLPIWLAAHTLRLGS